MNEKNNEAASSMLSLATQIDEITPIILETQNSKEVDCLLNQRRILKEKMQQERKSNCCGKEEYISFDNHSNLLDVAHYKTFIWPVCKEGLALNNQMFQVCKQLWKLNYRDYNNYLEATYIFT